MASVEVSPQEEAHISTAPACTVHVCGQPTADSTCPPAAARSLRHLAAVRPSSAPEQSTPTSATSPTCATLPRATKDQDQPWMAAGGRGAPSVSDTSGLDCPLEAGSSRRVDFQRSYSSGRSSYVSEVSSGGTLAAGEPQERRPDSTYDSLGSRHRSSEDEPLAGRSADTYSEGATDDEDEDDSGEDGTRRSPAKRSSRGQRHHQERRRSVRDRRRGVRRRSEPEFSPPPVLPDPSAIYTAVLPDPSAICAAELCRQRARRCHSVGQRAAGRFYPAPSVLPVSLYDERL